MRLAVDLLAEGVDTDELVQLAAQPVDPKRLNKCDVESLFRSALAELDVTTPSVPVACWVTARWIATDMVAGTVPAAEGADRLWRLGRDCGYPAELVEMLQLHDQWESAVGADRSATEAAMLSYAPQVISAADRVLADLREG